MIFIKIIIFTLFALLCSYVFGSLLRGYILPKIRVYDGIAFRLAFGAGAMTGLMVLIMYVLAYLKVSVASALITSVIVLLLIATGAYICLKRKKLSVFRIDNRSGREKGKMTFADYILLAIGLAMLTIQIVTVIVFRYEQTDAIRQISYATGVYEKGILRSGSAIMNLWAAIATVLGEHPLVFIYTILPLVALLLYYATYYEFCYTFFEGDSRKAIIAFLVIEGLNIWGYQSRFMIPITLLLSWFSIECFIVHALLPMTMIILGGVSFDCVKKQRKRLVDEHVEEGDYYEEEWDMKKHKIINARNLAIAWVVLLVMLFAVSFILNRKINDLHAATANLQVDLDNRCRIYEFISPNGSVSGYLLKGRDGSLTMIGGGGADNGEALYDFLGDYGYEIDSWYLYDLDESNVGAYLKCKGEKGVKVENTYLLNRTEI